MSNKLSNNSSCNILGGEHFWIRAEKYASSGDSAGIHVKPAVNIHDEVENNAIMRCSKCGEILMKDLIKTLTDHTPHYQLVGQNCMDYARDTFSKLLKLFPCYDSETASVALVSLEDVRTAEFSVNDKVWFLRRKLGEERYLRLMWLSVCRIFWL
jgi:hypothetical protein